MRGRRTRLRCRVEAQHSTCRSASAESSTGSNGSDAQAESFRYVPSSCSVERMYSGRVARDFPQAQCSIWYVCGNASCNGRRLLQRMNLRAARKTARRPNGPHTRIRTPADPSGRPPVLARGRSMVPAAVIPCVCARFGTRPEPNLQPMRVDGCAMPRLGEAICVGRPRRQRRAVQRRVVHRKRAVSCLHTPERVVRCWCGCWEGRAESRCRCGQGRAESRCRCGQGRGR